MTTVIVMDTIETVDVSTRALTWPEKAKALTVCDALTYEQASELLLGIKALRREVDAAFDPIITDAHRTHKTACDKKRQAEAPLLEAEQIVKAGLSAYASEQERLRRMEERRLQEEARVAEETRRLEEAAALEREALAGVEPDLEKLFDANELITKPVLTPPVSVATTMPKVTGIVHRDNWSARVTDLKALVKYVAAHPEHINLLTPNAPALNSLARSMKGHLHIDGVQAINTPTVAAGGR